MKRLAIEVAILVAFAVGLQACGKKEDPPAPVTEQPKAEVPSVDDALVAVLRQDPKADLVCYDTVRDAYLIHFPFDPFETVEEPEKNATKNVWFFVDKVPFWKLQNNTWFTKDIENKNYVRIWPDVNGLPCKHSTEIMR